MILLDYIVLKLKIFGRVVIDDFGVVYSVLVTILSVVCLLVLYDFYDESMLWVGLLCLSVLNQHVKRRDYHWLSAMIGKSWSVNLLMAVEYNLICSPLTVLFILRKDFVAAGLSICCLTVIPFAFALYRRLPQLVNRQPLMASLSNLNPEAFEWSLFMRRYFGYYVMALICLYASIHFLSFELGLMIFLSITTFIGVGMYSLAEPPEYVIVYRNISTRSFLFRKINLLILHYSVTTLPFLLLASVSVDFDLMRLTMGVGLFVSSCSVLIAAILIKYSFWERPLLAKILSGILLGCFLSGILSPGMFILPVIIAFRFYFKAEIGLNRVFRW